MAGLCLQPRRPEADAPRRWSRPLLLGILQHPLELFYVEEGGLEFAAGDCDALGGDHAEGTVGEMVYLNGVHGAGDVGGLSGSQGESPGSKLVGSAVGKLHSEGGAFSG